MNAPARHDRDIPGGDRATAVAVAPNGGRRGKADHPALPVTAEEIAYCAAECVERGAAMIHLHVRDRQGRHTLDAEAYRESIAALRRAVGDRLVVQMTTEAVGIYKPAEQITAVRAVRAEAASLAVRELCPDASAEKEFAALLAWMHAERIAPQFILYSKGDAERLADLRRRGIVPGAGAAVLFVLGRYAAGQVSHPRDLFEFMPPAPGFDDWMVCAFGPEEGACAVAAGALGGGARVGFENNFLLADGSRAAANADLVGQAVKGLAAIGRRAMAADALRAKWDALR
jgi:uncharacterized protein (DUF849 family)